MIRKSSLESLVGPLLRKLLMLLKSFLKAFTVYRQAMLPGQLFGNFQRKAVGIIELERHPSGNHLVGIPQQIREHFFELMLTFLQGSEKALFLSLQLFDHEGTVFLQLGERLAVHLQDNLRQLLQELSVQSQLATVPDRSANKPP